MTPEQIEMLINALHGTRGSNAAILIFSGFAAFGVMITVIWVILNVRLRTVDKLEEKLEELQKTLADIAAKMWTSEELDNRIDVKIGSCIRDHERNCPLMMKIRKEDKD